MLAFGRMPRSAVANRFQRSGVFESILGQTHKRRSQWPTKIHTLTESNIQVTSQRGDVAQKSTPATAVIRTDTATSKFFFFFGKSKLATPRTYPSTVHRLQHTLRHISQ